MNKKATLKSFIQGETIKLSVDGKSREVTFVRVSGRTLTVSDNDKEEDIDLERIDRITL